MNFEDIIVRLNIFSRVINNAIIGISLFEAFLVIAIGIVSNNLSTDNPYALYALIFFAILYFLILFIRLAYTANFPGSITNELKSERKLYSLTKDSERLKNINEFFVKSMERLNSQTCALNTGGDTHLCDIGIKQGVIELIEPLIDNTYFVLDTINTKFTVGIYLNHYHALNKEKTGVLDEKGIIILNDKQNKGLVKELLEDTNSIGEQLIIQSYIRKSLNNYEFVKDDYVVGNENYSIICSPMPYACDEKDVLGVLFIISPKVENVPLDLSTTLKIFNRVIANWIYRYNDCVIKKYYELNPEENL